MHTDQANDRVELQRQLADIDERSTQLLNELLSALGLPADAAMLGSLYSEAELLEILPDLEHNVAAVEALPFEGKVRMFCVLSELERLFWIAEGITMALGSPSPNAAPSDAP